MPKTQVCTKCQCEKSLNDFYYRKEIDKYRKACKECFKKQTKHLKYNVVPWRKHFYALRRRCNVPGLIDSKYYSEKGIKCYLTEEEIKMLWFRDKAYEMKKPSIDREDSYGDYDFYNCRFIEMSDNSKRAKRFTRQILQFDNSGNFIKEWNSIAEASSYNTNNHSAISNCLRKKSKTSLGYIWKYKND